MRAVKLLSGIFIALNIFSTCATGTVTTPDKYNLDAQLEKVPYITNFKMMGWNKVDTQSFTLQTSPSDFYLIILNTRSDDLAFAEKIQVQGVGTMVHSGSSRVIVYGKNRQDSFGIDKIYKFKDAEEKKTITDQLMGK